MRAGKEIKIFVRRGTGIVVIGYSNRPISAIRDRGEE
jgi:hypothetical protein